MQRIAIYPGTFDPITNGHVGMIERAARLFDVVLVAIAINVQKKPQFSLDDRLAMAEEVLGDIEGVSVLTFEGLLIDFAKAHQAIAIIRGLRAVSDFDFEFQLAGMNRQMAPEIETVLLPATEQHAYISATMIREIVSLGGDVAQFVPEAVIKFLNAEK